jgi:carboxylate-amine ligase
MLRQNRWRACRFGLDAGLVDSWTLEAQPARGAAEALIRRLEAMSTRLGCHRALGHALEMTVRPTGAERQLLLYREAGDLAEVVRRISARSRLTFDPVGRSSFHIPVAGWSLAQIRPIMSAGVPVS